MSTIPKQVTDAAIALYNVPGKPAGVPALEGLRTLALDGAALLVTPSSVIYPVLFKPELFGGKRSMIERGDFGLMVEHRAASDGTVRIDQVLDPLIDWAVAALSGQDCPGATGPYHRIVYGELSWDFKQLDYTYGFARQLFVADTQSNVKNLSSWAA